MKGRRDQSIMNLFQHAGKMMRGNLSCHFLGSLWFVDKS